MLSGVKSAVVRSFLIFTMLFVMSCAGTRKINYPPTEQKMIAQIDSLVAVCEYKDKLLKHKNKLLEHKNKLLKKCSDVIDKILEIP